MGGRPQDDGRHQPPDRRTRHDPGDLGILFTENLVHGSDSLASAEREIGIFFPDL